MHVKNQEFLKQFTAKFKNRDKCLEQLKEVKYRPELGPHFIYNLKNSGPDNGRNSMVRLTQE